MTKFYSCVHCGGKLTPIRVGALAKSFKHGFNSACPNDQSELERGSDQIKVEDLPVIMDGGRGLSYPRAGLVKYFQCENDFTHADYYRGEIQTTREPIWKRCPTCNGRMQLRSVRLRSDGTTIQFMPFQRPSTVAEDGSIIELPVEPAVVTDFTDQVLLRKFLRRIPPKFRRNKLPNSTKRVELHLKGDNKPYRKNGKVYSRKVVVIADSETQTVTAVLYGCAGWSPEIKRAGKLSGILTDVVVRPSAITLSEHSKKGKGNK